MKNKIKVIGPLVLTALLVFGASISWAAITDCIVGGSNCVAPGNDNPAQSGDVDTLRDLINAHLLNFPIGMVSSSDLTNGFLGKYDPPDDNYGFADINATSGSWSAPDPVSFITIKASNGYKLWDVMGATSGTFETLGINGGSHGLSHMSFWGGNLSPAVPIPNAALLFGTGIIGLIGLARRKKSNQHK